MITLIVLSALTGLYGALSSWISKILLDTIENTPSSELIHASLWPAIFFVLNYEFHNMVWRGIDYINLTIAPKIKNSIIEYLFSYIHNCSFRFFQENFAGTLGNNITLVAENIEKILHNSLMYTVSVLVQLIVTLISMYYVNPIFALGLFVWVSCFLTSSFILSSYAKKRSKAFAQSKSVLSGALVDSFQAVSSARLFARNKFEVAYLKNYLEVMRQKFIAKEWFIFSVWFWQGLSITLLLAFMLFFLFKFRVEGLVSIGDFVLILGLVLFITENMWDLTEHIDIINDAMGQCNQSLQMLLVPLEIEDMKDAKNLVVTQGAIEFKQVQFHYKGTAPLFYNKSIGILPGQSVGLVGFSGSGKSTFVNLILRLFDLTSGQILIDGQDIKTVTQESLRNHIGMIPQDPALFHRSIMENIRYGRLDASDEEVIEAAKKAHAHEFIQRLPLGYQSMVGERGIKLSGGQRQRLSIARAILKNAPILILDEATSQLDSVTENDIQESLWELMQGKTNLVIAHRLSTLLHMDRIMVFDKGKIVEDGSHTELLAKNGMYKSLWEAQVEGFLPDGQVIMLGDNAPVHCLE
jgi:ATP-binding cassette subfamily B protein